MRLLDRFLLRELIVPLGYCLSGFLLFWIAFDLFSDLADFRDAGMNAADVALYYVWRIPAFMTVVLPVALLLALLYSLTQHSRFNELTAMRAAGISLARITAPYVAVGIAFSAALLLLSEFWAPRNEMAVRALDLRKEGVTADPHWEENVHFRNARHGRIWNIEAYNLVTGEMRRPQVSWETEDGGHRTLLAELAFRDNGHWRFQNVQEIHYPPGESDAFTVTRIDDLTVPEFTESPDHIRSEIRIAPLRGNMRKIRRAELSLSDILNYMHLHPDLSASDRAMLHTQLHARLASPWTCLVVVLVAIPFGAISGRRNAFVGVASSVLICFSYFVVMRFSTELGRGGALPAILAAWGPNVFFGAAGIIGAVRIR